MKVSSHGLQYRDLIKAGLNTELRDRLSQTQGGEPNEDDALVQAIKEQGPAHEWCLEEKKREGKTSDSAPSSGKNLKRKHGGAGNAAAPATETSNPPTKQQSTGDKFVASAGVGKGNPPRFTKEQTEEALKGVQQTLRDARDRKKLCRCCGVGGHRWQWCQKDIIVSSLRKKKEKSSKGEPPEANTLGAAVGAAKRSALMHTAGDTSQPCVFEIDSEEESD